MGEEFTLSAAPSPTPPRTTRRRKPGEPRPAKVMPFVLIQDSREQNPFSFTGIVGDSSEHFVPLVVPVEVAGIPTGDYSIRGMETMVCAERKSAEDLFSTLASGRERFENEHQRMHEFLRRGGRAVVVIEADWATMLKSPPSHTRLSPLSVQRTAISWLVKYGVPWVACPGRRFAEIWTFNFLRKFWECSQEESKKERELDI